MSESRWVTVRAAHAFRRDMGREKVLANARRWAAAWCYVLPTHEEREAFAARIVAKVFDGE